MKEDENVLRIFREARVAFERDDVVALGSLSNQTIHTASTSQDPDNIAVAVLIYSISKILGRQNYRDVAGWKNFYEKTKYFLDMGILALEKKDENAFRQEVKKFRNVIDKLSGKLKEYVQDVFKKASINKASKIYEHGISMQKTSNLLGVSMYELAGYSGEKGSSNEPENRTLSAKQRIKLAVDFFG